MRQLTEDALKMAEEWNQHSDIGLNVDVLLNREIPFEDALNSQTMNDVPESAANGNWKPLSFKFR